MLGTLLLVVFAALLPLAVAFAAVLAVLSQGPQVSRMSVHPETGQVPVLVREALGIDSSPGDSVRCL